MHRTPLVSVLAVLLGTLLYTGWSLHGHSPAKSCHGRFKGLVVLALRFSPMAKVLALVKQWAASAPKAPELVSEGQRLATPW